MSGGSRGKGVNNDTACLSVSGMVSLSRFGSEKLKFHSFFMRFLFVCLALACAVSVLDRRDQHSECAQCASHLQQQAREKVHGLSESVAQGASHVTDSMHNLFGKHDDHPLSRHYSPAHWWNWPLHSIFHTGSSLLSWRPRVDIEVRPFASLILFPIFCLSLCFPRNPFSLSLSLSPPLFVVAFRLVDVVCLKDSGTNMVIHADLPGVQASELNLSIDEPGVLRLTGTRKSRHEEKKGNYHHIETETGRFVRTFKISPSVKGSDIQAKLDHGVLTITVPKNQDTASTVKIQSGGIFSKE